jgi:AraC family transcriptional regulator of adaptative response / DNA-3-methyladenine glycosylase II
MSENGQSTEPARVILRAMTTRLPASGPVSLDPRTCYRALQARDARFDGRFFVAVKSTGVYCRPVCPARTPRPENCIFVPCAAAAAEQGFRPCLRCRPEASPGTPAWQGTSTTVSRALQLIAEGALDDGSVDDLADRLGVGARHLRRLFLEHLGASPLAVAQTRRLLFAKQLLNETGMPVSEIAFAAGFASIRRFNDAVRKTWDRTPRELRGERVPGPARDQPHGAREPALELRLPFRPPLDWDALIGFLALRAIPGVEQVGAEAYVRSIRVQTATGAVTGLVRVTPAAGKNRLIARVQLSAPAPLIRVSERLRRIFDLGADPGRIASQLRGDPDLAARVRGRPGLRVPGAWDGFELAVRAILGQQVSVRGATTLAGRVVQAYGEPLPGGEGGCRDQPTRLFPEPAALAKLRANVVGVPRARAAAIRALARAVAEGALDLQPGADPEATLDALRALPGVGEWTAQYIAMRALREPDAFPAGDLVLRKRLGHDGRPLSERELAARSEAWRPWRAYAALHLWTTAAPASRGRRTRTRKTTPRKSR